MFIFFEPSNNLQSECILQKEENKTKMDLQFYRNNVKTCAAN